MLPSTLRSCKWYLSSRFSHQDPMWTSTLPHTCYRHQLFLYSWFDHLINIWWVMYVTNPLIVGFPTAPVVWSFLGTNSFLITLFTNGLSLSSFLNMKDQLKSKKPTRRHLLLYCTSYRLNMFRALLCPSSGARDYNVDYHIGRFVLGLL